MSNATRAQCGALLDLSRSKECRLASVQHSHALQAKMLARGQTLQRLCLQRTIGEAGLLREVHQSVRRQRRLQAREAA